MLFLKRVKTDENFGIYRRQPWVLRLGFEKANGKAEVLPKINFR